MTSQTAIQVLVESGAGYTSLMSKVVPKKAIKKAPTEKSKREILVKVPIQYWSYSSLMAYLRNPLAFYKRYVQHIYDTPRTPAAVVGSAAHLALQHFYSGIDKSGAIDLGLAYIREVPDFEINFGVARTNKDKRHKRVTMEHEYLQAIGFYLEKPPRHKVVGVEVRATAEVPGIALPLKAVSDLVVESKGNPGAVDVVDHKFVDTFSKDGKDKTLFVMQAIFNYYTVSHKFGKPVKRFLLYELKKRRNINGTKQLRKYVINYEEQQEAFATFHRLINEATLQLGYTKHFLPNPSDMFEGENSFDVYRLGLLD